LVLTLLHAASQMSACHRAILKPHGVSPEQFNILRILKGAKGEAMSLADVASRMIDKNSNASRLIDKLLAKGLVNRIVCPKDRRRAEISLSEEGNRTIETLSLLMQQEMDALGDVWSDKNANVASDILDLWNESQP
jgi:DNA-binding MarR family transcriptional regulator